MLILAHLKTNFYMKKTTVYLAALLLCGATLAGCGKDEITEITQVNELKALQFEQELCFAFDNTPSTEIESFDLPDDIDLSLYSVLAYANYFDSWMPIPGEVFTGDHTVKYNFTADDSGVQIWCESDNNFLHCNAVKVVLVPTE
jgi:hypothetical protein